ncbi:MAG: proton extrusion protein PcxA [Nostocales cyanobacterium]|nr:MAG: proton extrusion protein PcxA [Nostocales cyanobacterium]TAF14566.1 MAG: proton extrusion protein PcxA [Nostocales cyanobacterium]
MKSSVFSQKIYSFLLAAYRWYLLTPERSLDEAYQTALKIKEIEDQHFQGKKISPDSAMYSSSVMEYFRADLRKLIKNVRMRLTEFKASRWFSNESKQQAAIKAGIEYPDPTLVLKKLEFIDQVIGKYTEYDLQSEFDNIVNPSITIAENNPINQTNITPKSVNNNDNKPKRKTDSTGILPRSILTTITRLQAELDPNSEKDVVQNFRQTQKMTILSVRFILLLIIVPLLTHQIAKAAVVGPVVEHFRKPESAQIFINEEMEEEALIELERFAEKIKFENMISNAPPLNPELLEEKMQEKAQELAEEFRRASSNAIKNVFADIFSVIAFIWLLVISKSSISVLKDFFDHIVYGLSDSAKAFIIILFTDVFVGFHSPHGWEVILEGVSRHWGLPANRDFIFLFIATFPVILDTIFKYWIFRYLNRISPSAVATYHNMNE